ncbi:MAG: periplasmic heavy metal sensor [Candidatus Eisenbacteria bacterium]|uniref:Periplasmic heavy metal sensor n=1 Tax=Eiseniibacteriota bacterium TaxID=2212470 RepID=A0A948RSS0_UNCEI|nr:periplasmic heavy metal sensor [Candidatus Eisenbacteria bacterium]MBU2690210.1 periplasmic heavy metal sensor [Candidatus Eisenbacteria bacterium]
MKRGFMILFIISLSLNAGFLGAAVYQKVFAGCASDDTFVYPPTDRGVIGTGETGSREQPDKRHGPASRWTKKRLNVLSRRLELDSAQKSALQASLAELESAALPAAGALRAERRELRKLMNQPGANAAEIRRLIHRVSQLQSRVDSLAAEGMLREMMVLRPEQRMKYEEAFRGRRHGHQTQGLSSP